MEEAERIEAERREAERIRLEAILAEERRLAAEAEQARRAAEAKRLADEAAEAQRLAEESVREMMEWEVRLQPMLLVDQFELIQRLEQELRSAGKIIPENTRAKNCWSCRVREAQCVRKM